MSNKDSYPIGYSDAVVQTFKKRSAFDKGCFLIPHLKETDHLLDCGCGPGSISLDFATLLPKGRVTGMDIEASQIQEAEVLKGERGVTNATFIQGNITALPFKDHTFDVSFTNAVLWTLSDPIPALKELIRVTKPGGLIACREPSAEGILFYPESSIIRKSLELQCKGQAALKCDRNLGKKLATHFSSLELKDVDLSVSSDVYSSLERRELLANYSISAWKEAPWAKFLLEHQWVTPEEIQSFEEELIKWQKTPGAFISATWCEALGRKP